MLCKIWGYRGSDYEEGHPLGYKNPVRTSQETHYFSATEPSRLMLCKIWSFHSGYYEECCLLEYKNPVRTSQETHYVSTTEPSRLILCNICDFHGGDFFAARVLLLSFFLARRFLSPWWWRRFISPKRGLLQEPHGVISQKRLFIRREYLEYLHKFLERSDRWWYCQYMGKRRGK
jgi:hypothetical protein